MLNNLPSTKIFAILITLYLLPSFVQFEYNDQQTITKLYFGLPIMQTGDEPHYYITLYSLVNDNDFFLTNNYNNAHYDNGSDLGLKKHNTFERHTRLFNSLNKTIINIPFIDATHLNASYFPSRDSSMKEISGHPIGLPLFAFIFLWPFRNTPALEHLSIYLTLFFSLAGISAFYSLMLFYHQNRQKAGLFTLILALGTQYWHYSKTFWAEPYLSSFLIIAWYLVVVKKSTSSYLLSGFLLGFGFLIKYPFLLTILPFYFYFILISIKNKKIEYQPFVFFSIPLVICSASTLYLNYFLTGNIFAFNQINAVHFMAPWKGMLNWLFNPVFGLITYAPILLFAFFGINPFWRKNNVHCGSLLLIVLPYFLFWTAYIVAQAGGGGYSARYLIPLIPLLVLFISFSEAETSRYKHIFYVLLVISIAINALAAIAYPAFTGYHIVTSLIKIVAFIL